MQEKLFPLLNKGMSRDLSISKAGSSSAFENHNIRILARDNDTALSITNERGNKLIPDIEILGTSIGWNVLNNYIIIFSRDDENDIDRIYRIECKHEDDDVTFESELLFEGNLDFSVNSPIESIVYYETDGIQKIYWVDGINVLRFMNFKAEKDSEGHYPWQKSGGEYDATYFDSNRKADFGVSVSITKDNSGPSRPNGVVQYLVTYFNNHGQESGIVWVSDIVYLSPTEYGGTADGHNNNTVKLTLKNLDTSFTNFKVYSIFKSTLNGQSVASLVADRKTSDGEVIVIDDFAHNTTLDVQSLLYLGSQHVIASTLESKDNTLFLGDLISVGRIDYSDVETAIRDYMFGEWVDGEFIHVPYSEEKGIWESFCVSFAYSNDSESGTENLPEAADIPYTENDGNYPYSSQLNNTSSQILSFKGGEKYRFGLKFKLRDGSDTDAFWIGDKENTLYPIVDVHNHAIKRVVAKCKIPFEVLKIVNGSGRYAAVQLVIADATEADRSVKAQGIVNPTMFNVWERFNKRLYSIPSWISRPRGSSFSYRHFDVVKQSTQSTGEIQCNYWKTDVDKKPYFQYKQTPGGREEYAETFDGYPDFERIMVVYRTKGMLRGKNPYTEATAQIILAKDVNVTKEELDSFSFYGIQWKKYSSSADSDKNGWEYYESISEGGNRRFLLERASINVREDGYDTRSLVHESLRTKFSEFGLLTYCVQYDTFALWYNDGMFATAQKWYNPQIYGLDDFIGYDGYYSLDECLDATRTGESSPSVLRWRMNGEELRPMGADSTPAYYKKQLMFIDENVVTLDSPEISYGETSIDNTTNRFRIVGAAKMSSILNDYDMHVSNSKLSGQSLDIINFVGKRDIKKILDGLTAWPLWKDFALDLKSEAAEEEKKPEERTSSDFNKSERVVRYWMYLWQKSGAIYGYSDEDGNQYSVLEDKTIANLRFSYSTIYMDSFVSYDDIMGEYGSPDFIRVADDINDTYRILNIGGEQKYYDGRPELYIGMPGDLKYPIAYSLSANDAVDTILTYDGADLYSNVGVVLRYSTQPHAIIGLPTNLEDKNFYSQTILPRLFNSDSVESVEYINNIRGSESGIIYTGALIPWTDIDLEAEEGYKYRDYHVVQPEHLFIPNDTDRCDTLIDTDDKKDNYLLIGEIYTHFEPGKNDTRYGGIALSAVAANRFIPAGPQYKLEDIDSETGKTIIGNSGDTYFQRWDALRVKPYSEDSENNVIDITSVMLETHINLDGRTDLQRGVAELASIDTEKFGSLNDVYSQRDNFFIRRDLDEDFNIDAYRSSITWTLEKADMAQVDEWTHITLASTLSLDGDKGICNSIKRFGNSLIAFQDRAISEILFNSRTPLSTDTGVPVELANSGKVDGKRYISNRYGCINKWSIVEGKNALYFVDNINKAFCSLNGAVENLSSKLGFSSWFRKNNFIGRWAPLEFNNIVSYYDKIHSDIYIIGKDDVEQPCLVYSEPLGAFSSFFDYGSVGMMANVSDRFVSMKNGNLWLQNEGLYCNFFGKQYPFWIKYRVAPDFVNDKVWTNLEYRADFYRMLDSDGNNLFGKYEDISDIDEADYQEKETFDSIRVWNEYQDTGEFAHRPDKKFKTWRYQIPRAASNDENVYSFDRIRNPWINLLLKKVPHGDENQDLMQLHDVEVKYFE